MARFNSTNARENAAKAHAARRRLRLASKLPVNTLPQTSQFGLPEAADAYVCRRLARVRAQLESVDRAIEAEARKSTPDGQRLNWLAQAQERLSEQERVLSDRPLPGSRRPGRVDPSPKEPASGLLEDFLEPLISAPVEPQTGSPTVPLP